MCKSKFFETVAATRTTGRITSTRRFRYDREVGDRAVRALFKLKRVVSPSIGPPWRDARAWACVIS